ncbi:hypothetical protein [Actinocatenispora thailandica]|uniref:hypothetical protein n=1 Tax=Actinocatenispora thailandica TaxID=227318 RepID=UPI00194F8485|nr:hypothetical protein [Actinocatenispora thailandica]
MPSLVGEEQVQAANALLGLAAIVNKVPAISAAGVLVATVDPASRCSPTRRRQGRSGRRRPSASEG